MSIELGIYLALLVVLYFYPNKQGSVGFFWVCCFVLFQWLINEKLGVDGLISTVVTGISLLLTFEISRRLWEEPFSVANVSQGVSWLIKKLGDFLSLIGFKPKSKLLDYSDTEKVKKIKQLFSGKQWNALELYLIGMSANDRYRAIKAVVDVKGRAKEYDLWLADCPQSVMALIFSAYQLIHGAWESRGGGTADTVTNKGIELFYERLLRAKEMLEYAIELDNRYADPYIGLMTISMGTGFDRNELWDYFAKATVISKDHYEAHNSMVNALAEKWGGEEDEVFNVARKTSLTAENNSPLSGIIAIAHIEHWLYLHMCNFEAQAEKYFYQEKVFDELHKAYAKIKNCTLEIPEHIDALNIFAFCFYVSGKVNLTKEIFEKLNGNYVEYPWGYFGEPFMATFNTAYTIDFILNKLESTNSDEVELDAIDEHNAQNEDVYHESIAHLENIPDAGHAMIILHNDEINGFGYVLSIVKEVFEYGTLKSIWLLIQVSVNKQYPVWTGPSKEAKEFAMEIVARGADPSMLNQGAEPLQVTLELI